MLYFFELFIHEIIISSLCLINLIWNWRSKRNTKNITIINRSWRV